MRVINRLAQLTPFQQTLSVIAFYFSLLIVSLTPFYGIAYLAALLVFCTKIKAPSAFSSLVARTIIAMLLLTVAVMITGVASWLLHIEVYAVVVISLFILMCAALFSKESPAPRHLVSKADLIAVGLALVAPCIIFASFYLPKPSHGASVQIMTNGFDNLAHLTLLRTNGIENSYAYGSYEQLKERVIIHLNSYPQGWHLATAHLINGFGFRPFDQAQPMSLVYLYMGSMFIWYLIAVYTLNLVILHILQRQRKRLTMSDVSIFAAYSLMIQLAVYWGCLGLGFASFIGCLAFLPMLVASILDFEKKIDFNVLTIAILTICGLSQTWILPAIAGLVSILLLTFLQRPAKQPFIKLGTIALPLLLPICLVVFQLAVILLFPLRESTNALLNEEGGIFGISILLLNVLLFGSIYYWSSAAEDTKAVLVKLLAICLPLFFMAYGIYFYQVITAGKASYFFTKTALLLLVAASMFFLPLILKVIDSLTPQSLGGPAKLATGAALIIALITATGQPVDTLGYLIQRNSKLSVTAADEVASYLVSGRQKTDHFVLLKDDSSFIEDTDATYFANRFSFTPGLCITNTGDTIRPHAPIEDRVNHLKGCASAAKGQTFLTKASGRSYQLIEDLKLQNIELQKIAK